MNLNIRLTLNVSVFYASSGFGKWPIIRPLVRGRTNHDDDRLVNCLENYSWRLGARLPAPNDLWNHDTVVGGDVPRAGSHVNDSNRYFIMIIRANSHNNNHSVRVRTERMCHKALRLKSRHIIIWTSGHCLYWPVVMLVIGGVKSSSNWWAPLCRNTFTLHSSDHQHNRCWRKAIWINLTSTHMSPKWTSIDVVVNRIKSSGRELREIWFQFTIVSRWPYGNSQQRGHWC